MSSTNSFRPASVQCWSLLCLVAAAFLASNACGGTECGPGTSLVDGQCVADDDSTPDCGEGTTLDESTGECVADGGETVCGPGTMLEDGECVPDQQISCGEMTTLQNGQCVIELPQCSPGTERNANTGACELVEAACSQGTALSDDGVCIPTDQVCTAGTEFNSDMGVCLPDACEMGDVLLDGVCVEPAAALVAEADVQVMENDDPRYGGTPNALTLEAMGEQAVFTGTIEAPTDLSGDGDPNQDSDVFEFDATAGQWLMVSVQSLGLPAPWFEITGPNGFERASALDQTDAARIVVAPYDGTYRLRVLPQSAATYSTGPVGDDEWNFVGAIEEVAPPTPSTLDISSGTISADLRDLTDNLYTIQGANAGEVVTLTIDDLGDDAIGSVLLWQDATLISATEIQADGDEISFLAPSSGTLTFLLDWREAAGLKTNMQLSGESNPGTAIGSVGKDATKTETAGRLSANSSRYFVFDIGALQRFQVLQSHDEGLDLESKLWTSDGVLKRDTRFFYGWTELVPEAETYVLELTNPHPTDVTNLEIEISTQSMNDLGDKGIGDTISYTQSSSLTSAQDVYGVMTLTERAKLIFSASAPTGEVDAWVQRADLRPVYIWDGDNGNQVVEVAEPGTYAFHVSAWTEAPDGFTLDVQITDPASVVSSAPHLEFGQNPATVDDAVNVAGCGTVDRLRVNLDITHPFREELDVMLAAPGGTTALLYESTDGWVSADKSNLIGWFPGYWTPVDSFDVFQGKAADGTWILEVSDSQPFVSTQGTLNSWELVVECQ